MVSPQKDNLGRYSAIAGREAVPVPRTTACSTAIVTHSRALIAAAELCVPGMGAICASSAAICNHIHSWFDTSDVTNSPGLFACG
jgi:hypothetical protein